MMWLNNFRSVEKNPGVLQINIYPVVEYPKRIKVSKIPYDNNYSPGKWRKRISDKNLGDFIYYYDGDSFKDYAEEVEVDNPLFGKIFRKYLLDLLSENISPLWQLKRLSSTLNIVKEVTENYEHSDKIKLEYELIIRVHHWQNTNFGLIVDLKINVFDRETNQRISYPEIKDRYGEDVRKSIWRSVQAFHKHLTTEGKKYATAMRDKFSLITNLLKEVFHSSEDEKLFETSGGKIKIIFKPLEIVEVANDDGI